jgi:cobyrinic acid a,c-diamide synthase
MTILNKSPRLVVAGLAGDSGKSVVSLAILNRLRQDGMDVRAFKKGPDYIDSAWLSWVTGNPARNLDSWMMGFDLSRSSFERHCLRNGFNLVEGNRGLFDGFDSAGSHSTAEMAKTLQAPILLVVNVAKMTSTAAALVLGCQHLDPDLQLAGVILNRVHGSRHETVVRAAIESATGLPVVGAIPAMKEGILPDRHLGLVTPSDHQSKEDLQRRLDALAQYLDTTRIVSLAERCTPLDVSTHHMAGHNAQHPCINGVRSRIAIVRDAAFNFYYPENLEALAAGGAELEYVSALEASELPKEIDAIYIGGGFPEVHAAELEANTTFLNSLAEAAQRGVPIYAECGGLMLLSRSIRWQGKRYSMSGAIQVDVDVDAAPQGHGYVEMAVTEPNPFYLEGTVLRGHEFHYSRILPEEHMPATACAVQRGTGCYDKRDGIVVNRIWASYTHLHTLATPEWAAGLLRAALRLRAEGTNSREMRKRSTNSRLSFKAKSAARLSPDAVAVSPHA